MHCPFCGASGEGRDDGAFVCAATAVDLSQVATAELARIAESDPDPDPTPGDARWGGTWHCPSDGTQMIERHGFVTCDICGRSLPGRLLYQPIESNWHPRPRS